ncbi:hypothetical protein EVA_15350 [gut metagenome]|uniref:Uncharacterized protein n=1 Tax=gut metagenome TaxID=749906 RepID=J9GAX7_9ZZZZ
MTFSPHILKTGLISMSKQAEGMINSRPEKFLTGKTSSFDL